MNLEYVGQNQDSGLYAKKSGVIFFKPKLFGKKHGAKDLSYYSKRLILQAKALGTIV